MGVLSLVVEEFRQAQDREGVVLEKEVDFLVLGEQLDLFLLVDPIDVDDGQGEEVPPCLQDEGIHQREGGGEGEGKGCPFVLLRFHTQGALETLKALVNDIHPHSPSGYLSHLLSG